MDDRADVGYGLAPLWSLNGRFDREQLLDQLAWMDEQLGMTGVFLHPRPGLREKFLTHNWMEHVQDILNEADERSLDVWLYDEDSYPSGFAGGQLLEEYPQYRSRGLRYVEAATWEGLPHDALDAAPTSRVFALTEDDEYRRVSAGDPSDDGSYLAFYLEFAPDSNRFNGLSYADLRNPDAVDAFLEIVYESYATYFNDYFGDRIPGVFTDEPKGSHHLGTPDALDWSEGFAEEFAEEKGYDLRDHLPALVKETPDATAVRFDYYDVANRLFVENFTARVNDWCAEHDLFFTGHFMEHQWPNVSDHAATMPHLAEMSMPGIDCLFQPDADEEQTGNDLMIAELDSVCRQFGGRRGMCETWGGMGWHATEADLKRMVDWLLVGGVDFVVPHFVLYSLGGIAKRDWPPSYGPHLSGAPALRDLFQYVESVAQWLDEGERDADSVAVVHPGTTVWTEATPGRENEPAVDAIGDRFQSFVSSLYEAHVGFDLVDETILSAEGRATEDGLTVGAATYDTIVIPDCVENLRASTVSILESLEGTDVRCTTDAAIRLVDGDPSDRSLLDEIGARRSPDTAALVDVLSDRSAVSVTDGDGAADHVYTRLVSTGDEWRCFAVNRADHETRVSIRFDPPEGEIAGVHVADTYRGEESVRPASSDDGGVYCAVTLPAYGTASVTFDTVTKPTQATADTSVRPAENRDAPDTLVPAEIEVEPDVRNVALLDFCDLRLGEATHEDLYVLDAQERVFDAHGIDYGPDTFGHRHWWKLVREGEKRARDPGFVASFSFEVSEALVGTPLTLVVERPDRFDVTVNGTRVEFGNESWLDPEFRCAPIGDAIRRGENTIRLTVERASLAHALEPMYVRGEFAVESPNEGRPRLRPVEPLTVGDLTSQGYPFYEGWVTYAGTVEYRDSWGEYALTADSVDGFVATATVNGTDVGTVGHEYARRTVTDALVDGKNDVTVSVYVSPANLLGPNHHEQSVAELGIAYPGLFTPHRDEATFAESPVLTATGLREPFTLERVP